MEFTDNYIKFTFSSDWDTDMLIALLMKFGFDSFEEDDNKVISFKLENSTNVKFFEDLHNYCELYKIEYTKDKIKNSNWNEDWEKSYDPVMIDDFCIIKANFHNVDTSKFKYVIDIDPKMTFGTGHHETTEMMIRLMKELRIEEKKVLDFGSGTGVLAILAELMGAKKILAIDNDPIAVTNIADNALKNKCEKISSKLSDHVDAKHYTYNLILANIDKFILSKEVENLSLTLKKGGILLISGILKQDKGELINLYENHSLKLMKTVEKGNWAALKFIAY